MRRSLMLGLLFVCLVLALAACTSEGEPGPAGPAGAAGPAGPAGPAGAAADLVAADLSCTECHNDTNVLSGKTAAWEESIALRPGEVLLCGASSAGCAGCHSGGGFTAMVAAGINPQARSKKAIPTRLIQDCRTCHEIHTTLHRCRLGPDDHRSCGALRL